jgi:hypothetical protein
MSWLTVKDQKICTDCGEDAPHYRIRGKRNRISAYCKECCRLRRTHHAMIQRCHDPQHPKYHNYGGRGIQVHPAWHDFHVWRRAMGPRPKGLTIERIDNECGYEPGNVRWATRLEQAQNKRNNVLLEIEGRTQTVAAWAREKELNLGTLWDRLHGGLSPEEAVNKPIDISRRHNPATPEIKKQVLTLFADGIKRAEIARRVGRSAPTITAWLRKWGVME